MKDSFRDSKTEAQAQMRRAETFWEVFERTVHRIRFYAVLECQYNCQHHKELLEEKPRYRLLQILKDREYGAHDMRLSEECNLASLAESARGAEMMSRIWYEEGRDMDQEDFFPGPPMEDWEG
jgi:hypothetical protein